MLKLFNANKKFFKKLEQILNLRKLKLDQSSSVKKILYDVKKKETKLL